MTYKDIIVELTTKFTRERILNCAQNDNKKPLGFLVCYIKDCFGVPKTEGHQIAEDVLKFFNINNETLGKLY